MSCKRWFLMICAQILFSFQLAYAAEKTDFCAARMFIRVSTTDTENPDQFIQKIKKNLITILAREKVLKAGYPKPCLLKEQADKSQICVAGSSVSLEGSSQLLLSEEGWILRFRLIKFPSPMSFTKQIYLVSEGFKSKLKFMLSGMKDHRDYDFEQIQLLGDFHSRKFDEALDRAIIEAGAIEDKTWN